MKFPRQKLLALLMLFALAAAACGGGDDDDTDAAVGDDTEETTDDTEAEEDDAAGGDAEGEEAEGEGGPPDGPPDVNPCAEGTDPADAGLPPAEEPAEGATAISVTARDYEFEGAEALDAGGTFAIELTNEGTELHEMAIVRLAEGEERPLDELLASEEEPETTDIAFGFACPGTSTTFNAEITEPGRYVALCFIPVGTTPETDPASFEQGGPPHAANGMVHEFTID